MSKYQYDKNKWRRVINHTYNTAARTLADIARLYGRGTIGYPDGYGDTNKNNGRAVHGIYTPSKTLSVSGGKLRVHMFTDLLTGVHHVGAPSPGTTVDKNGKFIGQLYGKFSFRMKSGIIPGYKVAVLLWSDADKWNLGEIDFPEFKCGQIVRGFSHNTQGNPGKNQWWIPQNGDPEFSSFEWLDYDIEWTPTYLRFTISREDANGVPYVVYSRTTTDQAAIPHVPMHLVLQCETDLDVESIDPMVQGLIEFENYVQYVYIGKL